MGKESAMNFKNIALGMIPAEKMLYDLYSQTAKMSSKKEEQRQKEEIDLHNKSLKLFQDIREKKKKRHRHTERRN